MHRLSSVQCMWSIYCACTINSMCNNVESAGNIHIPYDTATAPADLTHAGIFQMEAVGVCSVARHQRDVVIGRAAANVLENHRLDILRPLEAH